MEPRTRLKQAGSMIELILGGARSGKSKLAESKAKATGLPVTYIATATPGDNEMAQRIAHHQNQRPHHWHLIEEPLDLAAAIQSVDNGQCILIDCLTLWVSNWLIAEQPDAFQQQKKNFIATLQASDKHIILVSNETGLGVIPMGTLSRQFVDESGWLHQSISSLANHVTLTIAGLPLPLKRNGIPCFDT